MYQDLLRKLEIFKNMPEDTLTIIGKRLKPKMYNKGEMIFSEFDIAKGVYFVKSGIVRLTKGDNNGKEIVVCIKKPGDLFAEACLFTEDGTTYPSTAIMLTDGEILFLNTSDIENELFINPELGIEIIRYMSYQLRGMTSMLRDIALLDVYTKTLSTLDRLATDFGEQNGYQMNIELPITVQDFANLIGARRESVSRVFSKLRQDNLIDVQDKKIIITDWCRFCTHYKLQMFA